MKSDEYKEILLECPNCGHTFNKGIEVEVLVSDPEVEIGILD